MTVTDAFLGLAPDEVQLFLAKDAVRDKLMAGFQAAVDHILGVDTSHAHARLGLWNDEKREEFVRLCNSAMADVVCAPLYNFVFEKE